MYSTLAGFVEPGESLEEAVAREVSEESGVRVGSVRYHSSQPWPFPASIMLGFYAEALTEEITIDPAELRDARWFTRDAAAEQRGARLQPAAPRQHRPPPDRGLDPAGMTRPFPVAAPATPLRRLLPALVLALAACASTPPSPERACESAANDDPKVKAIIIKGAGNPHAQLEDQDLLRAAKQDATLACLRSRGLIPRGGVERQKPL